MSRKEKTDQLVQIIAKEVQGDSENQPSKKTLALIDQIASKAVQLVETDLLHKLRKYYAGLTPEQFIQKHILN